MLETKFGCVNTKFVTIMCNVHYTKNLVHVPIVLLQIFSYSIYINLDSIASQ